MGVDELQQHFVGEENVRLLVVLIVPLVFYHGGYEIDEFELSHLPLVHLTVLNLHQVVAVRVTQEELGVDAQQMSNHLIGVYDAQTQDVVLSQIELAILTNGFHQVEVLTELRESPALLHEFSLHLHLLVHDHGYEVVVEDYPSEKIFSLVLLNLSKGLFVNVATGLSGKTTLCLGLLPSVLIDLHEIPGEVPLQRVIQTLAPMQDGKVRESTAILVRLKQVLIVFNRLLGSHIVHGNLANGLDLVKCLRLILFILIIVLCLLLFIMMGSMSYIFVHHLHHLKIV